MRRSIGAALAYFLAIFTLAFALGVMRTLFIARVIGEWVATLAELAILLPVAWFYSGWLTRRIGVSAASIDRLVMGVVAFSLLLTAELVLGCMLFDRSPIEQLEQMLAGPGAIGLLGQVAFAIFPSFNVQRRTSLPTRT